MAGRWAAGRVLGSPCRGLPAPRSARALPHGNPGFTPGCRVPGLPREKVPLPEPVLKKNKPKPKNLHLQNSNMDAVAKVTENRSTKPRSKQTPTFIYLLLKTTPKVSVCAALSGWQDELLYSPGTTEVRAVLCTLPAGDRYG